MFDVIIIGAGPAGSQVALRMAENGYSTVVIDQKDNLDDPVHKTQHAPGPAGRLIGIRRPFGTQESCFGNDFDPRAGCRGFLDYRVPVRKSVASRGLFRHRISAARFHSLRDGSVYASIASACDRRQRNTGIIPIRDPEYHASPGPQPV